MFERVGTLIEYEILAGDQENSCSSGRVIWRGRAGPYHLYHQPQDPGIGPSQWPPHMCGKGGSAGQNWEDLLWEALGRLSQNKILCALI